MGVLLSDDVAIGTVPTIRVWVAWNAQPIIVNKWDFDPTVHRHEKDGPWPKRKGTK
jgi:hypothetical protein